MNLSPKSAKPLRGPLRRRESHLWKREATDWYVEPLWTSKRLFEVEQFEGPIWDPACGGGNIIRSAKEAGLEVLATDINPRTTYCEPIKHDFFRSPPVEPDEPLRYYVSIVSNPPYGRAEHFVSKAIDLCPHGKVAMLLPANWVQGDKRSRWLEETPLVKVLFLTPRPSMPPGDAGIKPGNGTTDYAWFIWSRRERHLPGVGARIGWLRRDG